MAFSFIDKPAKIGANKVFKKICQQIICKSKRTLGHETIQQSKLAFYQINEFVAANSMQGLRSLRTDKVMIKGTLHACITQH